MEPTPILIDNLERKFMFYLYKWDFEGMDSVHGFYDTLEEALQHVYDYRGTTYYSPPSRIINKETGELVREFRRPHDYNPHTRSALKETKKKTIKGRWGFSGLPTNDNPNADEVMRLSESEAIERNDFICARVAEGDSAEGIAEEVGLSVQRVQEISKLWKPLQSV